jgi:hypothetical protein
VGESLSDRVYACLHRLLHQAVEESGLDFSSKCQLEAHTHACTSACSGVIVVLNWCYSSAIVALRLYYSGVTVVLHCTQHDTSNTTGHDTI